MKAHHRITGLLCLVFPLTVFSQGLKIQGNDYFIDNRTSYTVFNEIHPAFENKLFLDFEIAPENTNSLASRGHLLRIKNEETHTTYNVYYNGQGDTMDFMFNHEGKDVLITSRVEKQGLGRGQWVRIFICFDLKGDSLIFRVNDTTSKVGEIGMGNEWKPVIHFGRSEHVIDVPSFALRNLTIGDRTKSYCFPLNESVGEEVHDSHKRIVGHVSHADWLINDAYYWKFKEAFQSRTVAGSGFHPDTQEIYYLNKDSILFYNIHTSEIYFRKYANRCPMDFQLGMNFLDKEKKRLYMYDVTQLDPGQSTVAYLDLDTYEWVSVSSETLPTQLHHHSGFFDEVNRRYIIFGGFGNARYCKEFYAYDLETNHWSTLSFTGDRITPRYFSSMGYHKQQNALYLFGGMGNESGDQLVGRVYYYDLYKIDLNTNEITKKWEIAWDKENGAPVRGMVVNDQAFYTLCYPEHFSKSLLKLYRFSLDDGGYEILGDSIPIVSEKIKTHGNLYYDGNLNELFSVVQEFENDDIASTAKVYSISFPPVTIGELTIYTASGPRYIAAVLSVVLALALAGSGFLFYNRFRKRKENGERAAFDAAGVDEPLSVEKYADDKSRTNAIYLFGDFSIIDRQKREINYMLSTKLKHAFFLILGYSQGNGITSQEFSELLWPDKPEVKLKNSRGVTLNNLRKILGELDGIKLVHEKGFFKIVFSEACYCDYMRCLEITSESDMDQHINELVNIISRGKFLKTVDISLLDSFKEMVERKIEPVLFVNMEKSFLSGNYAMAIKFCEGIFNIDPLSEDAIYYMVNGLSKLKRADEARKQYYRFVAEYKKVMGEEYSTSLDELIESK